MRKPGWAGRSTFRLSMRSSTLRRNLALPDRFVMKPNHMSGAFRIVRDATSVQRAELEALAASWLNRSYGVAPYEWAYRGIRPRVLFEELLEHNGVLPIDYNIHCFDGEPRFVRVWRGKFGPEVTVITYDTDFRQIPTWLVPSSLRRVREESDPPPNFDRMLEIARKLSEGSDYVRVDLYNVGGRVEPGPAAAGTARAVGDRAGTAPGGEGDRVDRSRTAGRGQP